MGKINEIVKKNRKAPYLRSFVQSKLASNKAEFTLYQENIDGLITSLIDRYPFNSSLFNQVMNEWNKHSNDLRVTDSDVQTHKNSPEAKKASLH